MSDAIQEAKQLIEEGNYKDAIKIARKRHGKDDIDSYLSILDMLIEKEYLPALEEKGMYFQYYDPNHDNNDYGEKYFDEYLQKQPKSINVLCDKSMSLFNKGKIDEALEYVDKAYEKYNTYSKIEKPRISKKEVKMSKIELLIQAKEYKTALTELNKYETQYGTDKKLDLYKGQMLQKNGENEEAMEYLEKSLSDEHTLLAFNAKADALYELGRYDEALHDFNQCIQYEREAGDDLELITNFNYKAAFCCIKLGDNQEAVKHLNKTINMLNEHGRLPKDLESIYQKCSFKKDELMRHDDIEDKEFKKTKFISSKYAIYALIVIIILYAILKIFGY
ncbi:tetratricopeptide repeat protein [Methanobrevibacter sp.]|uniref:tetratricopeptide repeat protein n=1 Tax=Methanobrevibacter sp. TaxID=66852 RepID=UPI002E75D628|nr:tetratricopeptide repeat protein [Methanobrevibacter sp.]MEE0938563.1 tetratricopeptide repeat protein [Methanobrevibacter sp.]